MKNGIIVDEDNHNTAWWDARMVCYLKKTSTGILLLRWFDNCMKNRVVIDWEDHNKDHNSA